MRMHADRHANVRPDLREPFGLCALVRVAGFEDHEHALEASIQRARDDLLQIRSERLIGQVTVAVDHDLVQGSGFSFLVRGSRFTVLGSAILLSNARNAVSRSARSRAFVGASAQLNASGWGASRFSVR